MSVKSSSVASRDKKYIGISVSEVDTGAQLVAGLTSTLEPDEALRIRCALNTAYTSISFKNLSLQKEDR